MSKPFMLFGISGAIVMVLSAVVALIGFLGLYLAVRLVIPKDEDFDRVRVWRWIVAFLVFAAFVLLGMAASALIVTLMPP